MGEWLEIAYLSEFILCTSLLEMLSSRFYIHIILAGPRIVFSVCVFLKKNKKASMKTDQFDIYPPHHKSPLI